MIQEESDDSPLITLASGSLSVHVRQPLCQKDTHATHPSDAKIHHGSGSETLLQPLIYKKRKNPGHNKCASNVEKPFHSLLSSSFLIFFNVRTPRDGSSPMMGAPRGALQKCRFSKSRPKPGKRNTHARKTHVENIMRPREKKRKKKKISCEIS